MCGAEYLAFGRFAILYRFFLCVSCVVGTKEESITVLSRCPEEREGFDTGVGLSLRVLAVGFAHLRGKAFAQFRLSVFVRVCWSAQAVRSKNGTSHACFF